MKLSSRDQLILAGVVIAIVAVLVIVFLIVPQFQALGQLQSDMEKAESDVAAAQTLLATRQASKAKAAETQAQILQLDNQIPDAPELPALIIDLQDTADDAGVEWDRIAPSKPPATDPSGYLKMNLSFAVVGQWDDVCDYLRRLFEIPRGVRVISVDVTPEAASTTASSTVAVAPTVRATLAIEVYSLPRSTGGSSAAPAKP